MKLIILVMLATCLTFSAADDEKCNQAAELFVKEYNANAGDNHVYSLGRVTACWTVGDDLHVSLTMTFDNQYYKPCVNVIAKSPENPTEIASYGTCKNP